jgi:small subunit ribosomal protein S18
VCTFCAEKAHTIDYKQVDVLRRFVTEVGKIRSRRETGTCARHQRILAKAIKRSRHLALIPFAADRTR